jgi:hypothetical protein
MELGQNSVVGLDCDLAHALVLPLRLLVGGDVGDQAFSDSAQCRPVAKHSD